MSRIVAHLLYGTSATDRSIHLVASVGICRVALSAVLAPLHRATRVDPNAALRRA